MISNRLLLLAAAMELPLSLAACGGSSSSNPPDSGVNTPPVTGPHYGYVVSEVDLPAGSQTLSPDFGFDIAGPMSNQPDGTIDNQLGGALSTLTGFNFPVQATITDAVNQGSILLLADLQTTDFTTATSAGFTMKLGANPTPTPCTNPADTTTCGQQLKGTGTFTIATNSPNDAPLTGPIAGGTLTAGPGSLALQIAIGSSSTPIPLNLTLAHVKATQISADGLTAVLGGAVTSTDLMTGVLPAVYDQVNTLLVRDCGPANARTGATCTCMAGSTGGMILSVLGFLSAQPPNCAPSVTDFENSTVVKGLVRPDVCTTASCPANAEDGLSFGVKVKAVKATFPM